MTEFNFCHLISSEWRGRKSSGQVVLNFGCDTYFPKVIKISVSFSWNDSFDIVFLVYKECGCFLQSTLNYPRLWRQDKLSPDNQMNVKKTGPDKQVWLIEKSRYNQGLDN